MNPNKALWEKGDFSKIAALMRHSGEALVDRIGVQPGNRVLDLGCGDGTTAIPAARRGAEVLGVDIARNLVEAGKRRAAEEGLSNCIFREGDCCSLHDIEDRSFDLVVSIFGAMFAPKPFDVAKEMVRVARPGGRVVMGNWIPNHPTVVAQMFKICSAYSPPPPEGFISPMLWGLHDHVIERFGEAGVSPDRISCSEDTFNFRYQGSPKQVVNLFRTSFGPAMNAFEAAELEGRADALLQELEDLFTGLNVSKSPDVTETNATFLRVVVHA